jgi:hypothetical protein
MLSNVEASKGNPEKRKASALDRGSRPAKQDLAAMTK